MQQKKLRITIPEPCHERWDQMSPTEKGAYCQSCAKEVKDFTGLTSEEVAYYFKHNSNVKTCGRFRNDQLNTVMPLPADPRQPRRWMNAMWMIPLTLFGKFAFGQQKPPVCERPANYGNIVPEKLTLDTLLLEKQKLQEKEALLKMELVEYRTLGQAVVSVDLTKDTLVHTQPAIRGRVINANTKAGLPLAVIKINDSLETRTDSTGNFLLELPEGITADSATVTLEGFSGKFIALKNDSRENLGDIALQPLYLFEWNFTDTSSYVLDCGTVYGGMTITTGWTVSIIDSPPELIAITPEPVDDPKEKNQPEFPKNIKPFTTRTEKNALSTPLYNPEKQNNSTPENPKSQKQPEPQAVMPVNNSQRKRK